MGKGKNFFLAKPVLFVDLTEEVLVRAGRIIDAGSGFFTKRQGYRYRVGIRLVREVPDDLEFLRAHFGGYYRVKEMPDTVLYWLNIQSRRAKRFIDVILPHLQVQREVAQAVKDYFELIQENNHRKLTDEVVQARIEAFKKIMKAKEVVKKSKL